MAGTSFEAFPVGVALIAGIFAFMGLGLGRLPVSHEFPVTLRGWPWGGTRGRRRAPGEPRPPTPAITGWVARLFGLGFALVAGATFFHALGATVALIVLLIAAWWRGPNHWT